MQLRLSTVHGDLAASLISSRQHSTMRCRIRGKRILLTAFTLVTVCFLLNVIILTVQQFHAGLTIQLRSPVLLVGDGYIQDSPSLKKINPEISTQAFQTPGSLSISMDSKLPRFNATRPVVFLHIGKSGGTSFDGVVGPIIHSLRGRYVGNRHFDWSFIQKIPDADVVVMLRNPVARTISHFYFSKTKSWAIDKQLSKLSLEKYLHDPRSMLEYRDVWRDGAASIVWLTGTSIARWAGVSKEEILARERRAFNITEMLYTAARRLESTFWFGILEDRQRSFELLQHQLGIKKTIILPKSNVNSKYSKPSKLELDIIESLVPQDLWLYEYAKLLFEARWQLYKTGTYKKPAYPPIPKIPCLSTRFIIWCRGGPLSPLYFADPNAPEEHRRIPSDVLQQIAKYGFEGHHTLARNTSESAYR